MTKKLAVLLLFSAVAFGQAGRYDNYSWTTNTSGALIPVPASTITVCNFPMTGQTGTTPCTNLAAVCTDSTMSSCSTGNASFPPDSLGNFGFWIAPGLYEYSICTNVGCYGPYEAVASNGGSIVTNAGVFTGAQTVSYSQTLIGGMTDAEFHTIQTTGYATQGIFSGMAVPSGATKLNYNAIYGAVTSAAGTPNVNAVAGYFTARATAANANVWGLNPLCMDGGFAGVKCSGIEVDVNVNNTNNNGAYGVIATGYFNVQPTFGADAYVIDRPLGTGIWNYGILFNRHSAQKAVMLFPDCVSGTCDSQAIYLEGLVSNATHDVSISAYQDGSFQVALEAGGYYFLNNFGGLQLPSAAGQTILKADSTAVLNTLTLPTANGTVIATPVQPSAAGNSVPSFNLEFIGRDAGGVPRSAIINGSFAGDLVVAPTIGRGLVPTVTSSYTLGASALTWQSLYTDAVVVGGGSALTWYKIATHASLDLASVANAACSSENSETITGAAIGDSCSVAAGTALEAGGFFRCAVTATDTAKWQLCNMSGSAIDRASDTYTIRVIR